MKDEFRAEKQEIDKWDIHLQVWKLRDSDLLESMQVGNVIIWTENGQTPEPIFN